MYEPSPGFGLGSNYLGYVAPQNLTTSQSISRPGFGAGSNYLGYVSPEQLLVSGADPSAVTQFIEKINDETSELNQKPSTQPTTAPGTAGTVVQPQTIDYLNAELAKHYGMSAETAYQEALANTSYQRAMKDMQAAGLNPAAIFGSGKGSGADGVSYVSSGTTGSGPSGGTTAKSNKKDNLFSEGAFYGISAAIGLVGALLMKNPTGYWIGQSASQGAMGAANAAYKSHR